LLVEEATVACFAWVEFGFRVVLFGWLVDWLLVGKMMGLSLNFLSFLLDKGIILFVDINLNITTNELRNQSQQHRLLILIPNINIEATSQIPPPHHLLLINLLPKDTQRILELEGLQKLLYQINTQTS
jgi:hypothetical protein